MQRQMGVPEAVCVLIWLGFEATQEGRFVDLQQISLRSKCAGMNISPSQYFWLSSVFSSSSIRNIAEGRASKQIAFYAQSHDLLMATVREVLDDVYHSLLKSYRNEYVYKNEIINRIRAERHDIAISHIFSEFKTGKSRTDLAVFNGTSTCYEIKTEIDTIRRLEGQIADYIRFFDKVYLVAPEKKIQTSLEILQPQVGILLLDEGGRIETIREAISDIESIDPLMLFRALHKEEYLGIAEKRSDSSEQMDEISKFHLSKQIFCSLSPAEAHAEFMEIIRRRKSRANNEAYLSLLPSSLTNAFFSTKMSSNQWKSFLKFIDSTVKEINDVFSISSWHET